MSYETHLERQPEEIKKLREDLEIAIKLGDISLQMATDLQFSLSQARADAAALRAGLEGLAKIDGHERTCPKLRGHGMCFCNFASRAPFYKALSYPAGAELLNAAREANEILRMLISDYESIPCDIDLVKTKSARAKLKAALVES